ncbi:hypothetical protein COV06_01770 [Candidatus Uhrbacteria bacterium CG10_big_fil_rev_8_21_14_0_10_50_16]|uniref:Ribosomal RNA small subunit methyltransferase E n=1 Tax=Candidatus Uhrbacteria bacterium CG10_big_fil_rev_8_21_14_0_10_50_16 TaxID=1975039 RepID=A0A2H0RNX9_9BACT|nr:MAG: hypothetical protein COV06_01770 [Candidatus Uhrbacteria bacterium CG10_big_fil_rev_8_21_14_0_10_50_16]
MEINNARQFHIHPSLVREDAVCIPIGELYRQMTSVLRLGKGDAVRFFDGVGNVYEGVIAHSNKDGILIPIQTRATQPRGGDITLAMAILKNDRMRWVLEKATELGVSTIIPIITERVIKRPETYPPRWNAILKEAAEQSGRAWLPELRDVATYHHALTAAENSVVYSTHASAVDSAPTQKPVTLFVGPEGGFTQDEVDFAVSQNAQIVSLGAYQFRADTAALVALARIQ